MISQYFYLPSNQKATEEERIAFTQERLAIVNEWLDHDFVRTNPGSYSIANMDGQIVDWKLVVAPDKRVTINKNWFDYSVEWFCSEHKCKLDTTDLMYLIMLLYRKVGMYVKPVDGSLCVSLFFPKIENK